MQVKEARYELIPHTADCKLRIYGKNLPELFNHALQGMFEICKPRKSLPGKKVMHSIALVSSNIEYLLVDFLSECLALSDIHNEAFDHASLELLTNTHLMASVSGYKIESFEGVEIKAVTYHELDVHQENNNWIATIVFDI
jgi:SHS2 domain-containing protein